MGCGGCEGNEYMKVWGLGVELCKVQRESSVQSDWKKHRTLGTVVGRNPRVARAEVAPCSGRVLGVTVQSKLPWKEWAGELESASIGQGEAEWTFVGGFY